MESTLTVKGQAAIPKPIPHHLGLKAGDRVRFFLHPDGTVVLLPKFPVRTLQGMIAPSRRGISVEQMGNTGARLDPLLLKGLAFREPRLTRRDFEDIREEALKRLKARRKRC